MSSLSTFPVRQRLIDIARAEVGTVETPAASNSGPRVKEYQSTTSLGGTGWPWCAAFVCWCIQQWWKDPASRFALERAHGLKTDADFEKWRPKTAAAFGFHQWAESRGLEIFNDAPGHTLKTGDIMTFDMSHIGLVITDYSDRVQTIEGNTSDTGTRDGGGVFIKTRRRTEARRFIRILPP